MCSCKHAPAFSGPTMYVFNMARQDEIVLTEVAYCQKYIKTSSLNISFLNCSLGEVTPCGTVGNQLFISEAWSAMWSSTFKKRQIFCKPHALYMYECVRHSTSMYNPPPMFLFAHSHLCLSWLLNRCHFSSSSVFTFDLYC